jgi:hypothetical protein
MVEEVSASRGSQLNGIAEASGLVHNTKSVIGRPASTIELAITQSERLRSEAELLDQAARRLLELSAMY